MYCTKCNGLKSRVALAVGNDLSDAELVLLEKQLKSCNLCRSEYEELQKSYDALQNQFDNVPVPSLQDSVWPQVSAKIAARRRKNRPTQFNFLLPTLTTVACCLALMLVTNSPQTEQPVFPPSSGSYGPVRPIGPYGLDRVKASPSTNNPWESSDRLQELESNPYGYNLPRLKHDVANPSHLHSVKF
ncbi:hypothetical protein [uncultured Gimesia sp.]|uniref:anti-sigma factor family protein n=1 Tax=uncultured Gimesia sp. TaxID=1678688 RepID=UPI00260A6F96|nr:hypothetical protein [uncultured Gimesia sp.]